MFIGEADQILNLDPLPAIIYSPAGVAPEHLVDFADDEAQIGLRQAFKDPLIYANPH